MYNRQTGNSGNFPSFCSSILAIGKFPELEPNPHFLIFCTHILKDKLHWLRVSMLQ